MGNSCKRWCFIQPSVNSSPPQFSSPTHEEPTVSSPLTHEGPTLFSPPPREEPTVTSRPPREEPTVSSPPPSIESIKETIQQLDLTHQIDLLISVIENQLQGIKDSSKEASTSSSSRINVDSVASNTKLAANIIDIISTEADKFKGSDIAKEMGVVALNVLKAVGDSHWMFLGLSVVAYALQRYVQVSSMDKECREVLEKLVDVAKDLKKFREAIPHESEKLLKAVRTIVEGAFICCDYIGKGKISRFWSTTTVEALLTKSREVIHDITESLRLALELNINRQIKQLHRDCTRRMEQSPLQLLEIQPVGIEKQVAEVAKLLDMEGTEPALVVVLFGFGGIGKSTLAASVIQSLNWSSTDFKFCRVIIDEKTADKTSHIIKLQKDIIADFGGGKLDLRNPEEGRTHIRQAMENKSCFLFIDNVADKRYISKLLPRDLLLLSKSNISLKDLEKETKDLEKKTTKLRIFVTSRENNLRGEFNISYKEHHVDVLSHEVAERLLRDTILEPEEKLKEDFDEDGFMNAVAHECRGVPLLLSVFAKHLRGERERESYEEALKALCEGNLDTIAGEDPSEKLSDKLLFVYRKLKDEEAQEAFLDICTYFCGWEWNLVAHILDSPKLEALHKRKLISKSDSGEVIVHDILRLMGTREAKETRFSNYEEWEALEKDESNLRKVKGISFGSHRFVTTLESRHLNVMCRSLRVLMLGDWVKVDGLPCNSAFKNLRFVSVGDMSVFPFEDASKLQKLTVFFNRSKHGMNLHRLPQSLKVISQEVADPACNSFETLPLQTLNSLQSFTVKTQKSVKLPEDLHLPASLVHLQLNCCSHLPKDFNNLIALECLILDKCDLESLPQGFQNLRKLKQLSMEHCTKLTSLPEELGSLSSMICLRLGGCTVLQKLPDNLGKLSALEELSMRDCENLRELPQSFGELSSLKKLELTACINLQKFPESFGKLWIESLTLQSLQSLVELPHGIGKLPRLKWLKLKSCNSLKTLPNSFVQLRCLERIKISNCIKLGALPTDFGQLSSLKEMTVKNCNQLKELPHGFTALPGLQILKLIHCSRLENLPRGFSELIYLKYLELDGLLFSTLPNGFGMLKKLQTLSIRFCYKLERLPDDFENSTCLTTVNLQHCPMLDETEMERIVKLQHCPLINIARSEKLIERWVKMREEDEHPVAVATQWNRLDWDEWERAARIGLLGGKCVEFDSTTNELMERQTSTLFDVDTCMAVIVLPVDVEWHHHHHRIQRLVEVAMEKSSSQQLRIVFVRNALREGERITEEEREEEKNCFRDILMSMPKGSCAIPSTDIKRHQLIVRIFLEFCLTWYYTKLACCVANVRMDDRGRKFCQYVTYFGEDDNSGKVLPISKSGDKENKISNAIGECIESITAAESPKGSIFTKFIQTLKENNADHLIDNNLNRLGLDQLKGNAVSVFMCDLNTPEGIKLQQICKDLKFKDSNFEGVWIPLQKNEQYGLGTYTRTIQAGMPWAALPDPNIVIVNNKNPRYIIFDKEGRVANPDALSAAISWGAEAYPFTTHQIDVFSNMQSESSLEFLLREMDLVGNDVKEQETEQNRKLEGKKDKMENKMIFLYAEPPSQKLKMLSKLKQLAQLHGNFEIVYVGYNYFIEEKDVETLKEVYEEATQQMHWSKLSFWDMIKFWYRCKYLSEAALEQLNLKMAETLKTLVEQLYTEKRWLVILDSDGLVTGSGLEVMDRILKPNDEYMEKELMESLQAGKCKEMVRIFFKDEITCHPDHPGHPLLIQDNKTSEYYCSRGYICDVCHLYKDVTWEQQRLYRCKECKWDLCPDCWEVFPKMSACPSFQSHQA